MADPAAWPALPLPRWTDTEASRVLQPRARATRHALLLAAATLVADHGYRGTSLHEITESCGATKGALYFHFPSKRALAEALVTEVFASWDDLITRIGALDPDPLRTLLTCYDAYTGRLMHDATARAALRIVQDEIGLHRAVAWTAQWENTVESLLVRAARSELLRPDVDAAWLSRLLLATATGHFQLAEGRPAGPSMWERMNDTWSGLLPAVTSPAWLTTWRRSGWSARPAPTAEQYRLHHLGPARAGAT